MSKMEVFYIQTQAIHFHIEWFNCIHIPVYNVPVREPVPFKVDHQPFRDVDLFESIVPATQGPLDSHCSQIIMKINLRK